MAVSQNSLPFATLRVSVLQGLARINPVYIQIYWLVVEPYPSEKYEFVRWDDDMTPIYGKKRKNVPNHQSDI